MEEHNSRGTCCLILVIFERSEDSALGDCFGVLSFISNIVMFYNSDDICTFLAFQKNLHVFVEMIVAFLFTFYLDMKEIS